MVIIWVEIKLPDCTTIRWEGCGLSILRWSRYYTTQFMISIIEMPKKLTCWRCRHNHNIDASISSPRNHNDCHLNAEFSIRYMSINETWIYHFPSESKRLLHEWITNQGNLIQTNWKHSYQLDKFYLSNS